MTPDTLTNIIFGSIVICLGVLELMLVERLSGNRSQREPKPRLPFNLNSHSTSTPIQPQLPFNLNSHSTSTPIQPQLPFNLNSHSASPLIQPHLLFKGVH